MPETRIKLDYPFGGLSENFAFNEQPPRTSRDVRNMRGIDPASGRLRGASRSGLFRFMEDPVAVAPVKRIEQVVYEAPNQDYTDLGDALVTVWSKANPSNRNTLGLQLDSQSNVYVLDGASGIAKFNSSQVQLFKISLPADGKRDVCRAFVVDPVTRFIYAAVSEGNDSTKARIWCYRQKDDNETDQVFEVEPGGFVEQVKIYNRELYCLLNFPDRGRSYIRVYGLIDTTEPEQQKEWQVPYPARDFDISPKDGSIFVASDANDQRGLDPRSPSTTQDSADFTPMDLTEFKKRIWSWHDSRERGTLALSPINPEAGDDGAEVIVWQCKMKTGRDWYANHAISAFPQVPGTEAGPLYRAEGVNGMPTISFTGAAYNGFGPTATAGRSMVGLPASSIDRSYRREQLSPIPTYKGAQFALFMVFKASVEEIFRGLLSIPQPSSVTTSNDRFRGITINRRDDNTLPGTLPMPGSVNLNERDGTASDSGESTPDAGGPSGPVTIAPGYLSGSGVCVLTWICDGGVHDGNTANGGTGTSTRSTFRVNGMPIDRWQSEAFKTAESITLGLAYLGSSGHSRFAGEMCEMLCLADWYDQDGNQQRLITVPAYPDSAWSANGDTEVERIEGYLAHEWGISHELATGQAAFASKSVGTNPANDETLTIDSVTYRFRTAGTLAQANDVTIGGNARTTMANLYQAINRIGEPGIDYDQRTEKHPTFLALAPVEEGATPTIRMGIRSISPYAARVTLSASSGGAITWLTATTQHTIAGAGSSTGWYPHPFTLKKTTNSRGGPPGTDTNTQAQISPSYLLQSPHPILSKWSANTGKLEWIATSGYDVVASIAANKITTAGTGIGGLGYGVRVNSEGEIYSVGPRQATVAGDEAIIADAIDLRKFGDTGEAFVTTVGGDGDPWAHELFSTPTSFESTLMRMDVDAFDNLYVPVYSTAVGDDYEDVSVVGYRRASTGVADGDEFLAYTDTHEAFAVVADPAKPKLPDGDTIQHGEFLYLATEVLTADTDFLSIFKLRQLLTTNTSGSVRTSSMIAVCNGDVATAVLSGTPTLLGTIDSNAQYVDSAVLFGKIFLLDGKDLWVYDPIESTLELYEPTSPGKFLPRCKLLASWRGRLVGARPADNGHNWFMTKLGDPFNCDLAPFTITEADAILGSDSRAGLSPDIITALIPYNDDLLIFGGDHSIHRMTGDPAEQGQFHLISDITGIAFGRAWAKDPEGIIYFFGSKGGVFRMLPGGLPQRMTLNRIERRLADIDLTTYRIEMAWSYEEDGLRLAVVPYGNGGTHVEHYFWERKTDAWMVDEYGKVGTTGVQPACLHVIDGDLPADRKLLFGCEDGRIRYYDRTAYADDTEPINSFVLMGPFVPDNEGSTVRFSGFEFVTAGDQAPPNWYLYASDLAQKPRQPKAHGHLKTGRSKVFARMKGAACWVGLGLTDLDERWAYEAGACFADPMGITRVSS